jgi:CRISPR-associated protein Cmr5
MSEAKQTPDQIRAKHAWDAVDAVKSTKDAKVYGGAARKLPVRIMASGLGQALAFLAAKGKTPALLKDLSEWVLVKRVDADPKLPQNRNPNLLQAIINGNSDTLREYTNETLAYLQWLNRFCEANNLTDDTEG